MGRCLICGIETNNPKFCSRNCSAKNSNFISPKRERKPLFCKKCGTDITYLGKRKRTLCNSCNPNYVDWSKVTLGDLRKKRKYQINSQIRDLARKTFVTFGVCRRCGYSKHTEIHHIKPISSFSDDSFIKEINSKENLVELCPNCHWEADNNY